LPMCDASPPNSQSRPRPRFPVGDVVAPPRSSALSIAQSAKC
jgi:hypothetical protein